MSKSVLHFSIGPVQGFVAQARRTRDLWAGSFLLSWLAGQAMAKTMRLGGTVVFPAMGDLDNPCDPLIEAILQPHTSEPSIGSLPNRFKAEVPAGFEPSQIAETVRSQWTGLAEKVWWKYIEKAALNGRDVRKIWDRQIDSFWDIQWVIGQVHLDRDALDGAWLDMRKNWRSHWPPEEGGDHCTIMGDWQELSGYARARERKKQDTFWLALQKHPDIGRLDLREGERLCAIALVKRLFPKLGRKDLENTIGWVPGGQPAAVGNWPSTSYMAVVPWLLHIDANESHRQSLCEYVSEVQEQVGKSFFVRLTRERTTRLPGLASLQNMQVSHRSPADLDGNLFLQSGLENRRNVPLSDQATLNTEDPDKEKRQKLLKALERLNRDVGSQARPFYALLLMDGDRLGRMLRDADPHAVSGALTTFTERVPHIVNKHSGVTIYAGGDDVLAMLPISAAVECALELRLCYLEAFKSLNFADGMKPSVSCAIVFAHCHNALQEVLRDAHHQLDDIAKDGNGRNSLALAIKLSGGINNSWVSHFETVSTTLLELRKEIANGHYSSSVFYNLRRRYETLTDESTQLSAADMEAVILAEYCKGQSPSTEADQQRCLQKASLLYRTCTRQRGDSNRASRFLHLDGAYIARWMAQNGFDTILPSESCG